MGNSESPDFPQFGTAIGFDPLQNDTITYTLQEFQGQTLLGQVSVTDVIGTGAAAVPDHGSTVVLLGLSAGGLMWFSRKKMVVVS